MAELCRDESESEAVQQFVQQLSKARLLVTSVDRESDQEYVEIIHDTLLREWRLLRSWLRDEDRRFKAWHRRVEKRAQNWLESNPGDPRRREENKLLRHHELGEAEEWLSKRDASLDQLERAFIHASIERTQQQTAREEYRIAVAKAWTDKKLDEEEVASLRDLANKGLKLSPSTAAAVERDTMGGTKKAILKRQERLNELYAKARQLHRDREWQRVVDIFAQIHSEEPNYPDPDGLLVSAREALELARQETLEHQEWGYFFAATVSEAVAKASATFGVPIKDLSYEVVDTGSAGFLGIGARDVRIVAEVPESGRLRTEEKSITKELNATDATRQLAQELGVDLSQVQGSGAEGRITVKDVQSAATQ